MNQGIVVPSDHASALTLFLNVPFGEDCLDAFCDVNYGPQDQSQTSSLVKIPLWKLCSMSGHIIL
eukprot:5572815-Ditylum_brightwellii.AAC.1